VKKITAVLLGVFIGAISCFSFAISYAGGVRGIGLLGVWFFTTFGIVVVLAQVIPAGVLFMALINGIFTARHNEMLVEA